VEYHVPLPAQSVAPEAPVDLTALLLAPVPEVVDLLEQLLDRARSGDLRSIACAGQSTAAGTYTCHELGDGDLAHLVTAMERSKLRLLGAA